MEQAKEAERVRNPRFEEQPPSISAALLGKEPIHCFYGFHGFHIPHHL